MQAKKAAKGSTRIAHKLASYTAAGELKCKICRSGVKNLQAAWDAHLISGEHRSTLLSLQRLAARKKHEAEEAMKEQARALAAQQVDQASPAPASAAAESGLPADFFADDTAPASAPRQPATSQSAPASTSTPADAVPSDFFDSAPSSTNVAPQAPAIAVEHSMKSNTTSVPAAAKSFTPADFFEPVPTATDTTQVTPQATSAAEVSTSGDQEEEQEDPNALPEVYVVLNFYYYCYYQRRGI